MGEIATTKSKTNPIGLAKFSGCWMMFDGIFRVCFDDFLEVRFFDEKC